MKQLTHTELCDVLKATGLVQGRAGFESGWSDCICTIAIMLLQKQESWELTGCQDSLAAWVLQVIQVWPCRWIPMAFGRETEAEAHSWCFCTFRTSMFLKRSLYLWSLQQWSLYSMRLACCRISTVLMLVLAGMCGFRSSRRGVFLTVAKEVNQGC